MLTIEEITILKIYADINPNRKNILEAIHTALPYVKDPYIVESMNSIIRKICAMSDDAFKNIDFSLALNTDNIAQF